MSVCKHTLAMEAKKRATEQKRIGTTINRLTFIRRIDGDLWEFRCNCGVVKNISMNTVVSGKTVSCGCARPEQGKGEDAIGYKHGGYSALGGVKTYTFKSYECMVKRCYDPRDDSFRHYGAKGIEVCNRWLESYCSFLEDMGVRPKGMSIERKDGKGNYNPDNCCWATPTQQSRNRESNKLTMELARAIRSRKAELNETGPEIITALGLQCTPATVYRVLSNLIWREDAWLND